MLKFFSCHLSLLKALMKFYFIIFDCQLFRFFDDIVSMGIQICFVLNIGFLYNDLAA